MSGDDSRWDEPPTDEPQRGRPTVWQDINVDLLKELASLHCTHREMAHILKTSRSTLRRHFGPTIKECRAGVKMSLRRAQIKSAEGGNPALLVWLGKQLLGQTDKTQVDGTHNVHISTSGALAELTSRFDTAGADPGPVEGSD